MLVAMTKENGANKDLWSPSELATLVHFVNEYGLKKFLRIPEKTRLHRSGQTSRRKWLHESTDVILGRPVSGFEKEEIFKWHLIYGDDWKRISKHIPLRRYGYLKSCYYKEMDAASRGNPPQEPSMAPSAHLLSSSSDGLFAYPGNFPPSPSEGPDSLRSLQIRGPDTIYGENIGSFVERPRGISTTNAVHAPSTAPFAITQPQGLFWFQNPRADANQISEPSYEMLMQAQGHQMEQLPPYGSSYPAQIAPQNAGYPASGLNSLSISPQDVIRNYFVLLYDVKLPQEASADISKQHISKQMQIPSLYVDADNGATGAEITLFQPTEELFIAIRGPSLIIRGPALHVDLAERLIKNFWPDATEANASRGGFVCPKGF